MTTATVTSKQPIPVTLIGYGAAATTFHLPFICSLPEHFKLFSIMQLPDVLPRATDKFPDVYIHDSIQAVFEGPNPLPKGGMVVVAIINALHYSTAKLALQNGYHVMCEKPLALNAAQVKELQAIAQENGVVCYTHQNRRFDGDFLTLQSVLPDKVLKNPLNSLAVSGHQHYSESIGEPRFFESHFDRYRPLSKGGWRELVPPEEGGGMLWDLAPHLIDQATSLFGAPQSILSILRNSRGQQTANIDDSFEVHLFYSQTSPLEGDAPAAGTTPAGLHCRLVASVLAAEPAEKLLRFKVHGTRGSFLSYSLDPQESQLKKQPNVLSEEFGLHPVGSSASQAELTLLAGDARTRDYLKNPIEDKTKPIGLEQIQIPVLQGRYKALYYNLAQTISKVNEVPIDQLEQRNQVIAQNQAVAVDQVAIAIRVLELARISAQEGRVVEFTL